jgi:hypothetical protein
VAKGYCPDCEELQVITPTGRPRNPDRGTDKWWRVLEHFRDGTPCRGSGKLI